MSYYYIKIQIHNNYFKLLILYSHSNFFRYNFDKLKYTLNNHKIDNINVNLKIASS